MSIRKPLSAVLYVIILQPSVFCFIAYSTLFLVSFVPAPSLAQEAVGPERIIVGVEVEGLKAMDRQKFFDHIETRPGRSFSSRTIDRDVRRLYALGNFCRISWRLEEVEGGVKVFFTVTENQKIASVTLRGVKAIGHGRILGKLKSQPGTYLNDYHLHVDRNEILRLYRDEGFFQTSVTHEVQDASEKGVTLVFVVREGSRIFVERIEFSGNQHFDSSRLKGQMKTVERAWYHHLLGLKDGILNRDVLLVDIERLRAFYQAQGFWDSDVWLQDVRYSPDGKSVTIHIRIEEGCRYIVRSISITGNTVVSRAELEPLFLQKVGEPAIAEDIDADVRTLRSAYGERAYLDVKVDVRRKLQREGNMVDLVYEVQEGDKTRLGLLEIRGNTRTRDKVIRRHVRLNPGEEVNTKLLERGLKRIYGLGYFESLDYEFVPGKEPGERDLILTVEEGRTGEIRLGGAYSGEHGIIGMLQYTQRNFDLSNPPRSFEDVIEGRAFTGGGEYFQISLKPGTVVRRYSLNYRNPYLYDWPVQKGFSVFNWSREYADYEQERSGGSLSLSRYFEDVDFQVGASYRLEQIEITDVEEDAPRVVVETEGTSHLITLTPSFGWDKRDSPFNPTEGWKADFEYEYGGTFLGGDYDFSKVNLHGEYHFNIYQHVRGGAHVLSLSADFGWVEEQGDTEEVPFFERYYAGGIGTIRGFDFHGISPREGGVAVGGNVRALASTEYSFPLYGVEKMRRYTDVLRGVIFVDSGTVTEDFGDLHFDVVRLSAGVGVRVYVAGPVPFALYFAIPLSKEDEDERESFHFSVGIF